MGFGDPSHADPSWSLDEEASRSLIRHAIEAGINFFNTANMYSNGSSEEILGRALKDFTNRDTVVLADIRAVFETNMFGVIARHTSDAAAAA